MMWLSLLKNSFSSIPRPVTNFGHQEEESVFREGLKFFELCPVLLNYVEHIFPVGAKIFLGSFAPQVTGLFISLFLNKASDLPWRLCVFHE